MLRRAELELRALGCRIAAGPMDGHTWHAYRFGHRRRPGPPPFFMEPANPAWLPATWLERRAGAPEPNTSPPPLLARRCRPIRRRAGFASRTSAWRSALAADDFGDRTAASIYAMSAIAFTRNFLYTPIPEAAFLSLYERSNRSPIPALSSSQRRVTATLDSLRSPTRPRRGTLIVKTLAAKRTGGLPGWARCPSRKTRRRRARLRWRRSSTRSCTSRTNRAASLRLRRRNDSHLRAFPQRPPMNLADILSHRAKEGLTGSPSSRAKAR
ncbi:MAG: hypothetical protein R3F11_26260 [Verrucomicrobiales bacterium]